MALAVLGSSSLAALVAPEPAVAAGKRADLVIASVGSPGSLVAGGSTRVSVKTRNVGRRAAPASTSTMWLSSDRAKGRSDRKVGSVAVARLRPGRTATSKLPATIPSATPAGQYFLVVCADARKKVRESKEGNNCRASRPVSVTGATPPPAPPPAGTTPSQEVVDELIRASGPLWSWEAQPTGTRTAPITVDESRTTTKTLGTDGGTLTVSTASGDSMTLTVPSGALVDDIEIAATPVTAIEGDTAVGARALGLRLAPEGLTLLRPAMLEVTPAEGVERAAVGVAGLDDGTGTGPALLMPEADRLAMPVHHFSHHTVLVATGEGGFTAQYVSDAEYNETVRNRIIQLMVTEREKSLRGEPEDPAVLVEIQELLDDYYAEMIVPLLERATTDCAFAEARLHEALAFTRQQALMGEEDPAKEQFYSDAFDAATLNCWKELTAECMPMDGVRFRKVLALARQAEMMGLALGDGEGTDPFEQIEWCGTLHGWIDGVESYDYAEGGITHHEEASWRIWITADPWVFADEEGTLLQVIAGNTDTAGSRYQGSGSRSYVHESDCTQTIEHAWEQPSAAFEGAVGVPHFSIYFTETGADPAPQPIGSSYVYGGSRGVDHDVVESDCHGSEVYEGRSVFMFLGNVDRDMTLTWDPERLAFDLSKVVVEEHSSYRATGSLFLLPSALIAR